MWSSDRRSFLALLAAIPVAACGFSPAMAPGASGHKLWEQVEIIPPGDPDSFHLVAHLESRLGPPRQPRYRLDWSLTTSFLEVADRDMLRGTLRYRLIALADGATLASGEVENFSSWTDRGDILASVSSQQDGRRRLLTLLGDQMVARLLAAPLP